MEKPSVFKRIQRFLSIGLRIRVHKMIRDQNRLESFVKKHYKELFSIESVNEDKKEFFESVQKERLQNKLNQIAETKNILQHLLYNYVHCIDLYS